MHLNADFSKRVIIRPEDYRWIDSPMPGVERMMLDRISDEVARAISWIRSPDQSEHAPYTDDRGALIYVKVGHLA